MPALGILASAWSSYALRVIPKDAPVEQRHECRLAFYAGAAALFAGVSDADEAKMASVIAELETFGQEVEKEVPPGPANVAPLEHAEAICANMARLLKRACPRGWGFVLVLADFGPSGFSTYLSSIDRPGAIKLLRDMANCDRLQETVAMTYWHESEEAKSAQLATDLANAALRHGLPPHPLLPCVLGPENAPPPAPREPIDAIIFIPAEPST